LHTVLTDEVKLYSHKIRTPNQT